MSSKSEHSSNNSVSQSAESQNTDQKSYIAGLCELCNTPVGRKNRQAHEKGKKHKNNLKKQLQRQGKRNNVHYIIPESYKLINDAGTERTQNNASNTEISKKSSEVSSKADETHLPPYTLQHSSDIGETSSNFPKAYLNKSHTMSGQIKPYNDYRSGQSNRGYSRPPRSQQFQNPNGRRQPWHQRYPSPQNWDGYGNRERNGWHPPLQNNRYFPNHGNPNEQDLFFMDSKGTYNNQYSLNENYFSFEAAQCPMDSQSNPADSSTPKTDEKERSKDLESDSTKSSVKVNVPKAKPLKRINQSVRAIRNASTASRNSIDSDDSHQDGASDKQPCKKNAQNEGVSGKRIAHWINPSNPKDEAEVRRLVTNFSRSRKKENLVMLKQQSEDMSNSASGEIGSTAESFDADKCLSSPQSEDSSVEILEPLTPQVNKKLVMSNSKRRSLNLEPHSDSDSRNSNHSSKTNTVQVEPSPRTSSGERKRKSQSEQPCSKSKKRANSTDLQSILDSVIRGEADSKMSLEASLNNLINKSVQEESTPVSIVLKREPVDSIENNRDQLQDYLQGQDGTLGSACSNEATMTPVESLINLFASGNIKVKKEFDDPLIDAIRNLDPAVLNKVCDNQPSPNATNASPANPLPQEICSNQSPAAENPHVKPSQSVTMSLKAILKELEKISKKERKIKESLQEADQKIHEYQLLLDEWKTKKLKIQSEEEILGHQRNTLVKSMNDLVTDDFTVPDFPENTGLYTSTNRLPSVDTSSIDSSSASSLPDQVLSAEEISKPRNSQVKEVSTPSSSYVKEVPAPSTSYVEEVTASSASYAKEVPAPSTSVQTTEMGERQSIEEEIAILPAPSKTDNIPVIDLVEDTDEQSDIRTFLTEDSLNDKLSNWKEISAHQVGVNAIQVFDGYMYTCSIDNTAKRFDLKDSSKTVTYLHEKKNVTQLCIEKINGLTVLFTVCSASLSISAFKAEDGTLLNTLTFQSSVASICRGRNKIYAGLRDGTIFTCNWKDQKEIVNIGDNLRSIALTYQGCISILITLAVNGNVSIRDAERNGLLIRTAKSVKNVPLSMKVYGDCIFLSGSGHVLILEIGTAKCVGQYDIVHPYTSLTTSNGYIFTTSYSGLVRCYSQFGEKVVQVYYGAGNNSLTCICIYNDWVFTGNRFGAVDVFKFNPNSCLPCQMGKCDLIFSREKDLELHILSGTDHDIPSAGSKCAWRTCRKTIPRNCKAEVIKSHIQEHIQAMHFQDEQTLYNLSL